MSETDSYELSIDAAEDLRTIYAYGEKTYGQAVAETYAAEFIRTIKLLATMPDMGRRHERPGEPGLRRFNVRSHVIFYRPDTEPLFVLRVIHQAMDVDRHL